MRVSDLVLKVGLWNGAALACLYIVSQTALVLARLGAFLFWKTAFRRTGATLPLLQRFVGSFVKLPLLTPLAYGGIHGKIPLQISCALIAIIAATRLLFLRDRKEDRNLVQRWKRENLVSHLAPAPGDLPKGACAQMSKLSLRGLCDVARIDIWSLTTLVCLLVLLTGIKGSVQMSVGLLALSFAGWGQGEALSLLKAFSGKAQKTHSMGADPWAFLKRNQVALFKILALTSLALGFFQSGHSRGAFATVRWLAGISVLFTNIIHLTIDGKALANPSRVADVPMQSFVLDPVKLSTAKIWREIGLSQHTRHRSLSLALMMCRTVFDRLSYEQLLQILGRLDMLLAMGILFLAS